MTDDELQRRLLSREVNERIRDVGAVFELRGGEHELLCECGASGCGSRVLVPSALYEDGRAEAGFVVARGHERPGERVLQGGRTYLLVVAAAAERVDSAAA